MTEHIFSKIGLFSATGEFFFFKDFGLSISTSRARFPLGAPLAKHIQKILGQQCLALWSTMLFAGDAWRTERHVKVWVDP
jgi:hypothetical protein